MAWAESTCHTVRCSKRAMKAAEAATTHHVKAEVIPEIWMTVVVVTIVVHVAAVVIEADVVVIKEAAAVAIAVAAVVTVGVEAAIEKIVPRGASDVTLTTTVGQVRTVQTETPKAAEIVAQGAKPEDMMEAVADLVRHADAKHF
jgi:hypothetical protein